jgi:predicted nucleotide-binding protein
MPTKPAKLDHDHRRALDLLPGSRDGCPEALLMTPDDLGKAVVDKSEARLRARQNVVFELGFFIGALSPDRVAAVIKGEIERPSDFDGVVYISFDAADWRVKLGQELEAAGYEIDWNKVMRA